jgi:CheY-like chemotaxis protein
MVSDGPKNRILIIDDDQAVRVAHQRMLERAGYDVRAASAPFEGLEMAADWPPDLIMLDLVMPVVSGFEALKMLKSKPATRGALVVAFSGLVDEDDSARLRRIGFDAVLAKPVDGPGLADRVAAILAMR